MKTDGSGTRIFDIKWEEPIGPPECPMMIRWAILTPLFSIRIHHFLRADEERHAHDHPWWFFTLVLRGEYEDISEQEFPVGVHGETDYVRVVDRLKRGSVRLRPALHRHWVHTDNAWTFVITGPVSRRWGFWDGKMFSPVAEYFKRHGYAPCQD